MSQRQKYHTTPHRQRGVALITALMLVAIVVTLATSIYVQQLYSIRLNHNIQDMEQAYQYVSAAETIASLRLKRDLEDNKEDSLFDQWAQPIESFEINDDLGGVMGDVKIEIEDLQAYFNINNILEVKPQEPNNTNPPEPPKRREVQFKALQNLLNLAAVPPEFAFSILDWIDPNDELSDPSSAENMDYLAQDPPYEAANTFLVDPSELYSVYLMGVSDAKEKQALLKPLLPYVVTLPTPTALNVNTALPETLEALGLTVAQVNNLVNTRKQGAIKEADLAALLGGVDPAIAGSLKVSSNYFRMTGRVRLGKSRVFLNSILFRSPEGNVHVIMRQFNRVARPDAANQTAQTARFP